MKAKMLTIVLALSILTLCGCGNKDMHEAVTLAPPPSPNVQVEEAPEEIPNDVQEQDVEPELQITNRTRIMVNDSNTVSKTPTEPIDVDAEPTEEDSTLSRFKKNIDKISMPKNTKISGTIKSSSESDSVFTVCYMESGEYYFFDNYDTFTLELYTENVKDKTKPIYIKAKNSSGEKSGYVDAEVAEQVEETKNDFRMTSIDSVIKNGNNYSVKGSYIWGGEQCDGIVTVGDNYTVYNIETDDGINKTSMKVQTLLKMPVTVSDFNRMDKLTEDDLTDIILGSFMDAITSGITSSDDTKLNDDNIVSGFLLNNLGIFEVTFDKSKNPTMVSVVSEDAAGNVLSNYTLNNVKLADDFINCCYHVNFRLDENVSGEDVINCLNSDEIIKPNDSFDDSEEPFSFSYLDNGTDIDIWFSAGCSSLVYFKEYTSIISDKTGAVINDDSWKEIPANAKHN